MLNRFKNLNIRYKLISTFSLFAVLIGLFVFFFFPYQQRKQILDHAMDNSLAISKMTADNLAASLEFEDKTTAQEVLTILKENEDFVFASVKDANSLHFVNFNQDRISQLNTTETIEPFFCQVVGDMTITSVPILSQGSKVGTLLLGLSIKEIKAEINRNTTIALLIIIVLIVSTIFTSMLIANVISKPIQRVIEVSSKIAQGDFSNELRVNSRDEVGKLAKAFNEMSRKLKMSIGERKKAEKEIIKTRDFLEDIFNTSVDGIMVTDEQGCIVRVNKAIEKMLGFRETELIGKHTSELGLKDEEHEKIGNVMLEHLLKKGYVKNWETLWYRKDGSLCPVDISITFIKDKEGNISGAVASIQDITYRKQIEEEHIRLSSAVKQATEMIMLIMPKGNIQYVNPATEKIMGYSSDEIIGQNIFQTERGIYDKKFYQEIQKTISKGTVWTGHITYKKKDGFTCECRMTISPIRDRSGKIINYVAIGRDVTEELKLEKQLQQAQKMEAIGTLAGGVAHDLNNILSGILTYPEMLLLDLPQDSPQRKPILTIKRSGEKAAAIVQDMLTLTRRGVAITEVVNLNGIISDYLSSPEFEKLKSFHPNIQLETKLEKDLLNVLGSPVHLSKTVMNLISNAAEALVVGGDIEISTTNQYIDRPIKGYDEVEEGDYVILKISDTGIGISLEDMERIFEPFYTKKVMGRSGTGLGMAVVWGTVKDHKGYIDVKSIEGKGTIFTLYFPVTRKELNKDKSPLSIEDYRGKGETILIVDDVNEQREIASKLLGKLGYSVTTVSSGEEAVEYVKNNSVDLLVLDMIMDPGIDGLETYQKILEIRPGQKAIIASGFSETDRVKMVKKLGAGAYIKKPYTLEKIGVAVKEELNLLYGNA